VGVIVGVGVDVGVNVEVGVGVARKGRALVTLQARLTSEIRTMSEAVVLFMVIS
jgi:GTP cyclohydrolase III